MHSRLSQSQLLKTSLWLSAGSLLFASISIVLGQQVSYLNYLSLFNTIALTMISLGIAALLTGLLGIWRTRGRSLPMWLANAVALLILTMYALDS